MNFIKRQNIKDIGIIFLFLIVIAVNISDFFEDGLNQEDAWIKVLTTGLSLWGIIMSIRQMKSRFNEISALHKKIEESESSLKLTGEKLKQIGKEYSKYLHKQFDAWKLSPSEKEIAVLMLKGLSFVEIAEARDTKEKTVRQQASALYKKTNVSSRHEFSAWFFEDMLG